MNAKKLKVQKIVEQGKWPYVGNAWVNKTGSITVTLDPGVTLSGGDKLHLRPARDQGGDTPAPGK